MHAVARGKNRECYFTTAEDCDLLLAHLHELVRMSEVTGYAYTLVSHHVHLLMQAPTHDALGRPLRLLMTETARACHKARGRRGHFGERRSRSCLVEEDTSAVAALRSLDRNALRAGLVNDPTTYPRSSCAAYALGTPNRVITFHPSYLALSPYAKVRQRQYRTLLAPSADPQADAPWTTQRAVGSPAFMAPYVPRRGRRRIETMPSQNQEVKP